MNNQVILDQLLELLQAQGIQIRTEPLGGSGGGLCRLRSEDVFFVDTDAPAGEVAELCAQAVGRLVDIDSIYIRPQLRQLVEKYKKGS